jgi:hypothetical protein
MFYAMGLRTHFKLPGLMHLQRPCDIDGHNAYQVTTFLEKGSCMVTILALKEVYRANWREQNAC